MRPLSDRSTSSANRRSRSPAEGSGFADRAGHRLSPEGDRPARRALDTPRHRRRSRSGEPADRRQLRSAVSPKVLRSSLKLDQTSRAIARFASELWTRCWRKQRAGNLSPVIVSVIRLVPEHKVQADVKTLWRPPAFPRLSLLWSRARLILCFRSAHSDGKSLTNIG